MRGAPRESHVEVVQADGLQERSPERSGCFETLAGVRQSVEHDQACRFGVRRVPEFPQDGSGHARHGPGILCACIAVLLPVTGGVGGQGANDTRLAEPSNLEAPV